MGSNKKIDKNLSFRNFSPFYERALAESKRGENILKIIEKDIDKRKMIAYSQLSAEQRIVQKDLLALKMAQRRICEDRRKRNRRAVSESGLDEIEHRRLQRRFTSMDQLTEISSNPSARKSGGILPPLHQNKYTITSKQSSPQKMAFSDVSVPKWNNRSSLSKNIATRSVSAPTFVTNSPMPYLAFANSKNVFDGQF